MDHPVLTVVIPVYNDAAALRTAVLASVCVLESLGLSFELILCEDAGTDGSREMAEVFARENSRIRVNHSDVRWGKGGALSDALAASHGDIFCFYDVDLSTDLISLAPLIGKIREGDDIVVGSRFLPGCDVRRTGDREAASTGFNRLVGRSACLASAGQKGVPERTLKEKTLGARPNLYPRLPPICRVTPATVFTYQYRR